MSSLPARRAERITATVLFADLIGFSRMSEVAGSEAAYLSVTQLLRLLDGIARRHGGSVDKYLGDKLMAVFGYPVPIDRAPFAACSAALEMRQRVADFNTEARLAVPLGLRVGINTGDLVGGDIHGPVVREFHVLGDAVNVAARFAAKAADGEIVVGADTHAAARGDFTWQALEPLSLKGKHLPVQAHLLCEAAAGADHSRLGFDERIFSEMVGRGSALAALEGHVHAVASGAAGRCVLIQGKEGSGKSRLLAALGERLEPDAFSVRQLRASPQDASREDAPADGRAPALARLVFDDPKGPRGSAAGLGDSLRVLLRSGTDGRPLLVVIEDGQWLDADSLAALEGCLPGIADEHCLLLVTARPSPAAARIAAALAEADPGRTIELGALDPADAEALVSVALGSGADPDTVELVLTHGAARGERLPGPLLLASFLAPALRSERHHAETRAERTSEAERRRAAVVFADLSGFTAMTESVGAQETYPVVAACLQVLDDVAREFGGTVDHYLGDCVMALFGVPHAIEDAPRAAVNTAIEMRRRISAFNEAHELPVPVDVHTGVATGLGIAGDISGPLIREFAVMGDHVDRADQLTHEAEAGQIFVDAGTERAVRGIFELAEVGPFALAGSPGPSAAFELHSTEPRLHRVQVGAGRQVFSDLVGREEPLREIRARIACVADGEGGIVSLSAEAGIGKSRLLAELRNSEEAKSVEWLEGRALSNGRNLSYHPIADVVRSWAGIDDADDALRARAKLDGMEALRSDGAADSGDTASLLAQLTGAHLHEEERVRLDAIEGNAAEKILRGAFLKLLRAASAARPLVIVMEDFHWADLSSVQLIESLFGVCRTERILFVNAFRPNYEETSGRATRLVREQFADRHTEVTLEPLDASAARTMVKNLFSGGDVPQVTRAAIEERAQGNPFYIEEVVRTLVDSGAVEVRDGVFHATARLRSVTIPDTVQEAVMARVDRLDLRRKAVLQAASVAGGTFHLDVLTEVCAEPDLVGLLGDLEEAEFIVPSDRVAGIEYSFKHPLIQEVTYEALLEKNRRTLHLAVARATQAKLDENLPGHAAMLAYHFGVGGEAESAEHYLFQAGDEAARSAASNEALHFFEQAAVLYQELHPDGGEPSKRARLEKSLAGALMNRGRLIEAVEHFDRATEFLGSPAPRGLARMGASFVKNLLTVLGRLYLGRPYGTRAATDRELELIDVMFRRAMAQSTTDPTRFFVDATATTNVVSRLDPRTVPESAALYSGITAIFSFGGISFDIGGRFLDVARELAEAGAVEERVLYYRTLRFIHNLLAGDWSEEHTIEMEAIEQGLREGRFWEASTYLDMDLHRQIYQGNFEAARDRIARLAEIEDLYEHELAGSARLFNTAALHVERREFDEALKALEAYYDEHSEVLFNMIAFGTRARINALRGDLEAALDEIGRAESLQGSAGRVAPFHASYVHSARLVVDVARLEQEREAHGSAVKTLAARARSSRRRALATAHKAAWRLPEALRLAGREASLSGRDEEADRWRRQAVESANRLGALPELARTFADAGRSLAAGGRGRTFMGRDSADCIAEARALFTRLDLRFDLAGTPDPA